MGLADNYILILGQFTVDGGFGYVVKRSHGDDGGEGHCRVDQRLSRRVAPGVTTTVTASPAMLRILRC